jgi:hypothetical protein
MLQKAKGRNKRNCEVKKKKLETTQMRELLQEEENFMEQQR